VNDADLTAGCDAAPVRPRAASAAAPLDANELLARGDRKGAITALIEAHGDALFGLCIRVLRDRALAEDVLQQAYLEAFRDIENFERRSSLRTWLTRIATHRCQDALKARARRDQHIEHQPAGLDFVDPDAVTTERFDQSRRIAALERCLNVLSDDVRMTVLLRFHAGMSYAEMSAVLGVRADTLHARVVRALPLLKRCLETKGAFGE
jgi:RNA polymerase sigma-70 factor (ECF subfamily)